MLSKQLAERLPENAQGRRELFETIGLRVNIQSKALELTWQKARGHQQDDDVASLLQDDCGCDHMQRVSIPYIVVAHKRRREIILPATASSSSLQPIRQQEQQNLVRAIAQGRYWLKQILSGTTIAAIAERESRSPRMIRMMLSLAFLDPKLVRAVATWCPAAGHQHAQDDRCSRPLARAMASDWTSAPEIICSLLTRTMCFDETDRIAAALTRTPARALSAR